MKNINKAALNYMRNILENSHTLARELLKNVILEEGSFRTICDRKLSEQEDFEGGRVCNGDESIRLFTNFIYEKITKDNLTCILENYCARKEDPESIEYARRLIYYKSEVYHYAIKGFTKEEVKAAFLDAETTTYPVGVLSAWEMSAEILKNRESNDVILNDIARKTQYISVGAYDGECYLIWSKE
jgi:hypothetical protein